MLFKEISTRPCAPPSTGTCGSCAANPRHALRAGRLVKKPDGQMELYLRWLEKHEMLPGESRPYGLVLCAEASREHIERVRHAGAPCCRKRRSAVTAKK